MKKLSSGYIMSIVMSVLLLLEVIGVKVDVPYVNEVTMAVLGVLIALGVVEGARDNGKKENNKGVSDEEVKTPSEEDSIDKGTYDIVDSANDAIDDILPKDQE